MVHGVLIELLQLQNKAVRPILGEEGDGGGRGGGGLVKIVKNSSS